MQLFEYCVIYKPKKESKEKGKIIVPLKMVLAQSAQEVTLKAAREIPEVFVSKMAECEVAVRPF